MSNRKVWDFWSPYYKKLWVQKVSLKPTRDEILKKIKGLNNQLSVLDIGCGVGELISDIHKIYKTGRFVGLDYSQKMIEEASGLSLDATWICEDIHVFDEKKREYAFDLITCTHSFPYYNDQVLVLKKMNYMLKDNGKAYMAFASSNSFYDSLCMFFVKFTTGKAKYPSVNDFKKMCDGIFQVREVIKIKEKIFMPSIYVFELEKR